MEKLDFKAEIVADSINEFGNRLTTFVVVFPRMVLAEFNTHRMLSRNSASSRAIPFEKMLKRVEENPFIPLKWMKDHKGMQGNEYFDESMEEGILPRTWLDARDNAIKVAKELSKIGLTKQLVNRLIEPFMWHTVIVTATEWENFFALRAHEAAEIHIQKLAYMMLEAYNKHQPKQLKAGEWHIPFGDKFDQQKLKIMARNIMIPEWKGVIEEKSSDWESMLVEFMKVKIATARCARVSYFNYEGKDDYEVDIKLHNRLFGMGHWSPFEHCAKSMNGEDIENNYKTELDQDGTFKLQGGWCGNFRGFIPYRKTFKGENASDIRVERK